MNLHQFRLYIARPVLHQLQLWSPAAENLVMGTGLVESNFESLDQDDRQGASGPAYGFFQMEAFTYQDLWSSFLAYQPVLRTSVRDLAGHRDLAIPPVEDLRSNLSLAVACCRLKYYRVTEPLPANDPLALTRYWKFHYNTLLGKGTIEQALPFFQRACSQ